jgi:DNA modification methylase
MAPEIAIAELASVSRGSVVLDPMMGSGTVLRHAVEFGHKAIGFDMDPLAVLMSRVWSTRVGTDAIEAIGTAIEDILPRLGSKGMPLPWIDNDEETSAFVRFWFGNKQRADLRRIAYALHELSMVATPEQQLAIDVHRVALSRIIITKSSGASLAADTSHSRPHKVQKKSDFDVLSAFRRSVKQLTSKVACVPERSHAKFEIGDARVLRGVKVGTADMVLTSPPYLNAIDYMRGHKLSLVWLGHSISQLRSIRASSIGAERKADAEIESRARRVQRAMVDSAALDSRQLAMVERYSNDLVAMLAQTKRVLRPGGRAILVVGNSCLKRTFIKNSAGVLAAAKEAGLRFKGEEVRELPANSRYLPMPKKNDSALGKRMRTESILKFEHVA